MKWKIFAAAIVPFLLLVSTANAEVCCTEGSVESSSLLSDVVEIQVPNTYAVDENGNVISDLLCPDECCFACGTTERMVTYRVKICRPYLSAKVSPECGEKAWTSKKVLKTVTVKRTVVVPCTREDRNTCESGGMESDQIGNAYKMVKEDYVYPDPIETWVIVDCHGKEVECAYLK